MRKHLMFSGLLVALLCATAAQAQEKPKSATTAGHLLLDPWKQALDSVFKRINEEADSKAANAKVLGGEASAGKAPNGKVPHLPGNQPKSSGG